MYVFRLLFCALPAGGNSLHEHIRLDPDARISSKYLLASLESDSDRLTKEDQVGD